MSYSDEDIVQAIKGYQERLDRYVLNKNTDKVFILNTMVIFMPNIIFLR